MNQWRRAALVTVLATAGMAGCSSSSPTSSATSANSGRATPTESAALASMPLFQVNTATTCVLLPATTLPGQPFEASVGCQWTGELKAAFDYKVEYETTGPTSCLARAVRFTDRSTGTPAAWSWRFPDGSTSSERSPVYVARPGSFVKRGEVVLVVSDGVHGDEALETLQIVDC